VYVGYCTGVRVVGRDRGVKSVCHILAVSTALVGSLTNACVKVAGEAFSAI